MGENEDLNNENSVNPFYRLLFLQSPNTETTASDKEPENIDVPKKYLTGYEKKQIEYDQTAQALDTLLAAWEFTNRHNLVDEVEAIKVTPVFADKLIELVNRL